MKLCRHDIEWDVGETYLFDWSRPGEFHMCDSCELEQIEPDMQYLMKYLGHVEYEDGVWAVFRYASPYPYICLRCGRKATLYRVFCYNDKLTTFEEAIMEKEEPCKTSNT